MLYIILKQIKYPFSIFKVPVFIFFGLFVIGNVAYSVYEQQSRYFEDGLKTKNLSWHYLEKLESSLKVAYSPNIAMPDNLKSLACHAWQGCGDMIELSDYSPDLIVISPDYPHYKYSEFEKYINLNNYYEIIRFNKESQDRTSCIKPSLNSPLYIFELPIIFKSIKNCVVAYFEMLDNHKKKTIIDGESILIYGK